MRSSVRAKAGDDFGFSFHPLVRRGLRSELTKRLCGLGMTYLVRAMTKLSTEDEQDVLVEHAEAATKLLCEADREDIR